MKTVITAKATNGIIIDFIYNENTGLYHWRGDSKYTGYTAEELKDRRV